MSRNFLGTTTTSEFLHGLSKEKYEGVVCVVAASTHRDAESIRELVSSIGMEKMVYVAEFADESEPGNPGALGEKAATQIYDFLVAHDEGDVSYLFACDGTVARSTGLMCAWMRLCGKDDMPVWLDGTSCPPNVLVYARLLAAGGVSLSQRHINERKLLRSMVFLRKVRGLHAHSIHVMDHQWRQLLVGDKRCELRHFDYKRNHVEAGDLFVFAKPEQPDDFVVAEVLRRRTAPDFEDLLSNEDVVAASGFPSAKAALSYLGETYGKRAHLSAAYFLDTNEWERRKQMSL